MNYNRAVMKLEVKQAMRQTRPHPMLVTLLFMMVMGAGAGLISWITDALFSWLPGGGMSMQDLLTGIMMHGEDYLEYYFRHLLNDAPQLFAQMVIQAWISALLVSVLTAIWNGLMSVGYAGYCLDMVRGMNPPLERVFGGFSRAGTVILAYILVTVFTFLWSMLFGLAFGVVVAVLSVIVVAAPGLAPLVLLLMLAAYVGFIIGILWAVLRYVMVPYAIIDSQTPLSALDAIRVSKNIMRGRKGSYYVLQLSFIGWYLLEGLIVMIGVIISLVFAAGSISNLRYTLPYSDGLDAVLVLAQVLGPVLIVVLLCGVGIYILGLWLTPYRTGCEARFYLYATGGQPSPYGGQSGPYGGQFGPYGGQPGPYGGQFGPYGGQPGPYGGQSGPYGGQSGPYGGQPGPYGGQSAPYYGGQSGPYNNNPYNYNPPSQSSFGGYPQAEQPPQYGVSAPQWGVPQAPEAPAFAAEPPAAPAAPAAAVIPESPEFPETVIASVFDTPPAASETPAVPETPVVPEAPVTPEPPAFPETVIASVFDTPPAAPGDVPAESADPPYEAPYAEPDAPGEDDTPQQPDGPSYSQF